MRLKYMPLIAIAIFLISCLASAAELRAGAAQSVITPPNGAPMAGYYRNRAATGVHDDLYAKALVLEKNGVRIALIACDVVALPREITERARQMIELKTGIASDYIMISATHSHTGPVILSGPTRYNLPPEMERIAEEYTASLPARIASSAILAAAALKPAQLRSAIGREDSLCFNRRYFMKDGTVGWNPGKLNPNILRPAGPIDSSVPLFYVETPDEKPIASYVNYALHQDTTGGSQFSADYAFALGRALAGAKGSDLVSIFTIGTAGNVNHIDVTRKEPQSGFGEAARIGAVLGAEVLRSLQHAPVISVDSIRVHTEVLKLPIPDVTSEEVSWAHKTAATFGQPNAAPFMDLVRAAKIEEVAARHGRPLEAEVQVIELGSDLAVIGMPGEVFVELGLMVKHDSPYPNTIIATLANGALGYIPNRIAFEQGAYEPVSSRCAPGCGEMLVDSALRQLMALFRSRHQQGSPTVQ